MIVSHQHKFIFIKTNKTAGTSVEIVLSRFCGDDDIITPISRTDEATRQSLGYRGPQNHLAPRADYAVRDYWRLWVLQKPKLRFYNHMPAREARRHLGQEIWNSYFKFCFERHPFDRVISLYYWRHKREPRPSITQFIDSGVPSLLRQRGYELYTIDDALAVDRVCRYENIDAELAQLQRQFAFDAPLELPRAKGAFRADRRDPHEILSDADKQRIHALFRTEFERVGFDY
jgi:hypothetical protein